LAVVITAVFAFSHDFVKEWQEAEGTNFLMKISIDCIPCFIRQALDAVRFATDDTAVHERVLREVLTATGTMDFHMSPPVMGRHIHRLIRELSRSNDPYLAQKQRFNRIALDLYSDMKQRIRTASNPFDTAVRLAIAGNIIDFGVYGALQSTQLIQTIDASLTAPVTGSISALAKAVERAGTILYLGDNAGEIVFDRLLIEEISEKNITFAVRGGPVINDATLDDAAQVGLTNLVDVIDNGSDAPGTVLDTCSDTFRRHFDTADLIIAKGQGNFETLSSVEKNIFFLLKAKCPVISNHIGCKTGSLVACHPADLTG